MKKSLILLIAILLCGVNAFAQNSKPQIEIGEKQKTSLRTGVVGVVATDDAGYYVLRVKSSGFVFLFIPIGVKAKLYLDYYSNDMKLQKSTELEGIQMQVFKNAKLNFEFIAQADNEDLYIYYSGNDKRNTYLYRSKLDKESFTIGPKEEVLRIKDQNKVNRQGTFEVLESPDGSKKAIISLTSSGRKTKSINLYMHYLKPNLELGESREEILPFRLVNLIGQSSIAHGSVSAKEKRNSSILLNNSGTLNILLEVPESSKWFSRSTYTYHIVSISDDFNQPQEEKIRVKGKRILDVSIKHIGNQLFCSGYFSNEKKYDLDGVFVLDLNSENLETIRTNIINFGDNERKQFLISVDGDIKDRGDKRIKKKLRKKKDVNIYNFKILDYFTFEDGSSTMIAEKSYSYTVTTNTPNANGGTNFSSTTYYVHEDLVFIHFDSDNELEWIRNFDKYQRYTNSSTRSVYHRQNGDNLEFVYMEMADKELKYLSVNKNGEHQKEVLARYGKRTKLEKYYFWANSAQSISEDEIIAFARRWKKTKMLKIKL